MKQNRVIYKKPIKDLPKDLLPREKALKYGLSSLSDEELLAISLGSGTKGINVIGLSQKILNGKSFKDLKNLSLEELQKIKGIGTTKALQILSIIEIAKRMENDEEKIKITSVSDVYNFLKYLSKESQEHMVGIYLNSSNELIAKEVIAKGSLNVVRVLPRDILYYALKYNCNGIIIAHNHPNGSSRPSEEDINFTKKLSQLALEMGFEILDHIIVGKNDYFSFAEKGLL
ncbi:RadC family protein [Sulfurihydrogenibium subterraneum]|uniref:RadC family protein n=1 Tax=Sulfurihydrogenibium subterraneum TaxID=171121 RepID=UPI000683DA11|nr:DNA repair protein RadC [Sulfurihydrogenibium subterraneum]